MPPTGLEAVYLANRDKLVRFLRARGADDAAEDLVHDLWLRVSGQMAGPVGNPLAYLFRAADMLMIDRYRSRRQAERREQAWEETRAGDAASGEPEAERLVAVRQEAAQVERMLRALGPRKEAIFRRARIDGVPQRRIAEELGISISTVESDLRAACRALAQLKEDIR
ncbi:RNA polymerase sigma factor [Sphingomonas mollis]|uniref:RNA polymerase sigma factor n=1 Tax=Sphingomonas mollis TaxID=2795726 RepID=A0ABS0XK24_9SPHN|nr:RNA polymerase sigma factor [Sphingomonas sp. BT553]MBJ6120392.1 RNA polymerase sigma factor [Sphingomonas sp. BT553]